MKMVMEKSWHMKNDKKSWHFVISHGTLPILPLQSAITTFVPFFADIRTLSISPESPHYLTLRIDYGDGRVTRGSSTKVVISQLWVIIFRHAIDH